MASIPTEFYVERRYVVMYRNSFGSGAVFNANFPDGEEGKIKAEEKQKSLESDFNKDQTRQKGK